MNTSLECIFNDWSLAIATYISLLAVYASLLSSERERAREIERKRDNDTERDIGTERKRDKERGKGDS